MSKGGRFNKDWTSEAYSAKAVQLAPQTSWWITKDRETFTKEAEKQMSRLRAQKDAKQIYHKEWYR